MGFRDERVRRLENTARSARDKPANKQRAAAREQHIRAGINFFNVWRINAAVKAGFIRFVLTCRGGWHRK